MKKIYFLILILIKLVSFFHLVLDTTTNSTPSAANGFSEENQEVQVSPTLSKEVGGGNAKEYGGSKNPQVNMKILELSVEAQKNTPGIGVLDLATMFRDFVFS